MFFDHYAYNYILLSLFIDFIQFIKKTPVTSSFIFYASFLRQGHEAGNRKLLNNCVYPLEKHNQKINLKTWIIIKAGLSVVVGIPPYNDKTRYKQSCRVQKNTFELLGLTV